jgi:hypothetical protein
MFDLFALSLVLALPYVSLLVIVTMLTPSWRWVVAVIVMSGFAPAKYLIWPWITGEPLPGWGPLIASMMGFAYVAGTAAYIVFRLCYRIRG